MIFLSVGIQQVDIKPLTNRKTINFRTELLFLGELLYFRETFFISEKNNFNVLTESFPLEEANEVLERLKNSDIEARAVLIP